MNGAESLVRTLVAGGVDVCFTNPGTSEMHFVAALDKVDGMRCVLGLFEGVVTGAADGYYRMRQSPAGTLLHLGPGLANGLANLHNAKKAGSGVVNIVGDHAVYHVGYNAPLTSDIEGIAKPMSHWVKTSPDSKAIAADGAAAIAAAKGGAGRIATLILPADTAWNEGGPVAAVPPHVARAPASAETVKRAAEALRKPGAMLLLGGVAVRGTALENAGRIVAKTGCKLQANGSNARIARGAGRVQLNRTPYVVELALGTLKDVRHLVLCGAPAPVSFFAYPDKPSVLTPPGCEILELSGVEGDIEGALAALAAELDAVSTPPAQVAAPGRPAKPSGKVTLDGIAQAFGALMPENAIMVDESVTTGRGFFPFTAGCPPHDWLQNMGGSIGYGTPVAVGAAVACPDRKVIAMVGDGSAMYTPQSLWTMARENLDVCVVIFANRSYQILRGELANVGAGNPGRKAVDMLTLDRPDIDWCAQAKALGVPAGKAVDLDGFVRELGRGIAHKGPYLVELEF